MGVEATFKDKISQTALYYAARDGKPKTADFLIQNGCEVNDPDLYHQTPIYYASRYISFNKGRQTRCV